MRAKFVISLLPILLLLTACSHRADYQYLTTHPKYLEGVVANCQSMGVAAASDATCVTAEKARESVSVLLHALSSNPQQFGKTILAAQIQLANAKAQYQQNPSEALAKRIQAQENKIAQLLAICKFVHE